MKNLKKVLANFVRKCNILYFPVDLRNIIEEFKCCGDKKSSDEYPFDSDKYCCSDDGNRWWLDNNSFCRYE